MSRQTRTLSVISDGNLSSASPQHRGNSGELVFLQSPVQVCLDDMPRLHQEEPLLCPWALLSCVGSAPRQALATWPLAVSCAPPASQLPAESRGEGRMAAPGNLRCCHQQGAWVLDGQTQVSSRRAPRPFSPRRADPEFVPMQPSPFPPHPAGRGRWPRGRCS